MLLAEKPKYHRLEIGNLYLLSPQVSISYKQQNIDYLVECEQEKSRIYYTERIGKDRKADPAIHSR